MNSTQLAQKFDQEWGAFRKYIASHPLTGFWVGVGTGAVVGGLLRGFLGIL